MTGHDRPSLSARHRFFLAMICFGMVFTCTIVFYENKDLKTEEGLMTGRPHQDNNTMVLLLTYFRSGSTFTADIIQRSSDVYYIYEPLQVFKRDIYFTGTKYCSCRNNICRYSHDWKRDPSAAMGVLSKIFSCRQTYLRKDVVTSIQNRKYLFDEYAFMNNCSTQKGTRECLQDLDIACRGKQVKLVKTIRVSMSMAYKLLKIYPNLKILHLLRDPRGTMVSRANRKYSKTHLTAKTVNATCKRMLNDVIMSRMLKEKYRGRIKTVLYETIATSPIQSLYDIYEFIGISVTDDVLDYVRQHTSEGNSDNGYFRTMRGNSTETAYRWQKTITESKKKMIEKSCEGFYRETGFFPIPYNLGVKEEQRN